MSDIDTAGVDSLKALDPNRPIREADIFGDCRHGVKCQVQTSGPWSDGMISVCATSVEYASF